MYRVHPAGPQKDNEESSNDHDAPAAERPFNPNAIKRMLEG